MMTLLEKSFGGLACLVHSAPQLLGKLRAAGEMTANALGKICIAMQTAVQVDPERLRGKFVLPEVPATRGALSDRVVPAIHIEEDKLFGTDTARVSAVDMRQAIAVRLDGVAE